MQENRKEFDNTEHTLVIEGRNAVLEAVSFGKADRIKYLCWTDVRTDRSEVS